MYDNKAVLILRMPQKLLDALEAQAYKNNLSRAEAIRVAISAYAEIPYTESHGNTKYATDNERALARKQQNARAARSYRERQNNAEAEV